MNAGRREEIRRMIALYKDPKLEGEVPGTLAILDALEECFEELEKAPADCEYSWACAKCGSQRDQRARLYCSRRCCPYSYDTNEGMCSWCAEPRADHPGAK